MSYICSLLSPIDINSLSRLCRPGRINVIHGDPAQVRETMSPKRKTPKVSKPKSANDTVTAKADNKSKPIHIQRNLVKHATEGCIVWLPAKEDIVEGCHIDPQLNVGAFDHPAIIISLPTPVKLNSNVKIAIVCLTLIFEAVLKKKSDDIWR